MLYPTLTSLLHPASPDWFRSPISAYLSLLPLRPQGVKHTIDFIASSTSQETFGSEAGLPDRKSQSSTISLSLEVITRASKVLSSVPSSLPTDTYLTKLAPQLLQLLDEQDVNAQRAAAYIIGNGILGRRKYGSPGAIGWKLFAQPIIETLNPASTQEVYDILGETVSSGSDLPPAVVSEASLEQALNRLLSLVYLHPNPGLTKRLIDACLLSLWGLMCYAQKVKKSFWKEKTQKILCTYFKTSVGTNKLLFLGENMLRDESLPWEYGAGTAGGIEIRKRTKNPRVRFDIGAVVEQIDLRVGEFMNLIRSGVASEDDIAVFFAQVCKNWLLGTDREGEEIMSGKDISMRNPWYFLMHAKLAQGMLEEYKDKLAATPRRIIELLSQILVAYTRKSKGGEPPPALSPKPSLATLENTAIDDFQQSVSSGVDVSSNEDSTEMISMALSLLSAILSSPEFSLDPETFHLLCNLRSNLTNFTSLGSLPTSLFIAATNISALLNLQVSLRPRNTGTKTVSLDPYASDRKEYDLALSYLADALPPIRAQGLSLLTSLIKKLSPVIDIQSTTVLLQSLLQDEDEFIYLSAIKSLGLLADRHPKTVLRMLVEAYIDPDEKSNLDVRIRTGEALSKTIESLGTALVGGTAKLIGESMITVAGRRAQKPKSASARRQESQREENARREAEEAWGGEIPSPEMDTEQQSLTQILDGWQGRPGADDLRARASALSILGTCIEVSLASLGSSLTSSAIDVGLSILALEPGLESAILRRAAVLLILSLARALDAAAEMGRDLGPGFGFERRSVQDVTDCLRRVGAGDVDEIVRGHSGVAVEALETWIEKSVMRGVRELGKKGLGGWGTDFDISKAIIDIGSMNTRSLAMDPIQGRKHIEQNRPRIEELG